MATFSVNTKIIKDLCFQIFGEIAIKIVVDYIERNSHKASIMQQVRPIANFLIYLKVEHEGTIDRDIIVKYIEVIVEKHSLSTAINIAGFLKGFLDFLYNLGYIQEKQKFSFSRIFDSIKTKKEGNTNKEEQRSSSGNKDKCTKEHELIETYDYYSVLNIPYTASKDEIKRAYHLKAMEIHPDRNPEDVLAATRFCTLNTIYRVLMKDSERFVYDITMGYRSNKLKLKVNRTKDEYKVNI